MKRWMQRLSGGLGYEPVKTRALPHRAISQDPGGRDDTHTAAAALMSHAIDVFLSTYNGERYVDIAIRSVLNQTFTDFRLYIVDDCSKDRTWEIICRYDDPRIIRSRNEVNAGLFPNLNRLIASTSGRWIKLIGQDDIFFPNCLQRNIEFVRDNPSVGSLWCYNESIDENGVVFETPPRHPTNILSTAEADRDCLEWGCLSANISNLFMSRDVLRTCGPFREDIRSADFDMMARMQGVANIARFTEVLLQVRAHEEQWSADVRQMENHIRGCVEVYSDIYRRAVEEQRTLDKTYADRLLVKRLATNEFNWILKALQLRGDVREAKRCCAMIGRLVPLRRVLAAWSRFMLPRYIGRLNPLRLADGKGNYAKWL
jgi:glycosyltransferase involved in cell wall biosynthesis